MSRFINLERGQKPKSFLLERMETLVELAGHPERCAPSIHVAGSKGKGSVTSMLAAILTAAGYKAARYMSPHVIDIRERLCLGDTYFDEEIYIASGDELRHITEELLPALSVSDSQAASLFGESAPNGCEPTFWELLTLLFFLCARKSNCDIMVVETGMGGRLDSTNVLDPLVSVITLIELEHTSILGSTLSAIAGEKAGIIKQGRPLILAKQHAEALEVFKQKTKEKNSPLFYFPELAEISNLKITKNGTEFSLSIFRDQSSAINLQLSLPVPGKVQAENAALAITALMTADKMKINEDVIRNGLSGLKIPGRFEKIAESPPFIIDGAHTPESLALCAETFCSLYGEGGILLFGCAADKDAEAMAKVAHNKFAKIIITAPGIFKISNPSHVYETFVKIAGQEKTALITDTQEAVRLAQKAQTEKERALPVLGTGSFYLVSEIRKYIL